MLSCSALFLGPNLAEDPLILCSVLSNLVSLGLRTNATQPAPFSPGGVLHGALPRTELEMNRHSVVRLLASAPQYVWAACMRPQDNRLDMILANLHMRRAPWTVLVAFRPGARATVTCSFRPSQGSLGREDTSPSPVKS